MSEEMSFLNALAASPDDVAGWSAFADFLAERGDPRGEFMQVQLALEDESRSRDERDALKAREAELLAAHRAEWLGPLVNAVDGGYQVVTVGFTRGWPTSVSIEFMTSDEARALAAPAWRMLRRLEVPTVDYSDTQAVPVLMDIPHPDGIRVFALGVDAALPGPNNLITAIVNGDSVPDLVARMTRLEELHLGAYEVPAARLFALPMPRLRVFRFDRMTDYPLDVLAANPTLGNVEVLHCHPGAMGAQAAIGIDQLRAVCRSPHLTGLRELHLRLTDFGDEGAAELVASGMLRRVKVLALRYGSMTDAGARTLAASPDLANLELLDLTFNALTGDGIAALAATGVQLVADYQHAPDDTEYLSQGDCE